MKTLEATAGYSVVKAQGRGSNPATTTEPPGLAGEYQTLIDQLLAEQRTLTAVEKFARNHSQIGVSRENLYRDLVPLRSPQAGEQYAFTVDLDKCSGCKACVSACHSLNGLDDDEVWRTVGLLTSNNQTGNHHVGKNTTGCENTAMDDASPSPGGEGRGEGGRSIYHSSGQGRGAALNPPRRPISDYYPAIQQHITTACHHCVEPACLEGCPVLAYDKDPVTGIVRHLDDQCIGCNYCVMKCPYEVPKYSSRLGIVRKCDMCANRLAVGEAPACAQACPSEAIRITLVKPLEIKAQFRRVPVPGAEENTFLPDSPDPCITLPTTQFISKRGLPADLFAADRAQPRLDEPHWPLVIMLLLTQAATGMFLAAAIAISAGVTQDINSLILAAFTTFVAGMAASALHLGQPLRAWRCFLGWRKSWLSREIISFNIFAALASPAVAVALAREFRMGWLQSIATVPQSIFEPMVAVPAFLGLGVIFTSAMVYADTHRPFWRVRLAFGNFFGAAFLLGTASSAILFTLGGSPSAARCATLAALVVQAILFAWRRREFHAALRNVKSPIHLNARIIRELLPQTTRTLPLLFAVSLVAGLLAVGNILGIAPVWLTFAALAMFSSEIIARHVFFAASASKRMPGGVAA